MEEKEHAHGASTLNLNQKMNEYLDELVDACGITQNLSMHVARHIFTTSVALANGIPIETVSKMLGHSSFKTTQIYTRIVDSKISKDMVKLMKDKWNHFNHFNQFVLILYANL